MPGDTTRVSLKAWPRELVVATVLAYRKAMGDGLTDWEATPIVRAAYLAAGGDPEDKGAVPEMVAAAARDHREWFWRPTRERIEREERDWKRRGIWPPPVSRAGGGGDAWSKMPGRE